jgi:hypothetical protein
MLPLNEIFIGSIGSIGSMILIRDSYKYFYNRYYRINERIFIFDFIKKSKLYSNKGNIYKFVIVALVTESFVKTLSSSFLNYLIGFLISIPFTYIFMYLRYNEKIEKLQDKLYDYFGGYDIKILDYTSNKIIFVSKKPVGQNDKTQLELIFKTNIKSIKKENNMFIISHSYQSIKYLDMPKHSIERLEIILHDLKGLPKYIETVENEIEVIHKYVTTLNPKLLQRNLENISHKMGYNKNILTIENKEGFNFFHVRKDNNRIYYLDEIITKIKTKNETLPFIAGVKPENGIPLVVDFLKLVHIVIFGKTGSGKSSIFRSILESLMYLGKGKILFYLCDFAKLEMIRYKDFKCCKWVEATKESIQNTIDELLKILEYRQNLFLESGVLNINAYNAKNPNNTIPFIIFVIDEVNGVRDYLGLKDEDPIITKNFRLLREGRKYGLLQLHAGQQSNNNNYVKQWKTQMSRGTGLLKESEDIKNAVNTKELQTLVPKLKIGEYYLEINGEFQLIKSCFTDDKFNKLYKLLKEVYKKDDNIDNNFKENNKKETGINQEIKIQEKVKTGQ